MIAFALRRPVATLSATLAVVVLGGAAVLQLPVTLLPAVAVPVLAVQTQMPDADPRDVEQLVTRPLESALASLPNLQELRSTSAAGQSTIVIRLRWGADAERAALLTRERLDNVRGMLPAIATRPVLLRADPADRPIAVLAMRGSGQLAEVARVAEEVHARRLEQVPGVAQVAVVGTPARELRLRLRSDRLRALRLSPAEVEGALRNATTALTGGTVRRGVYELPVRLDGTPRSEAELRELRLTTRAGNFRVAELAELESVVVDGAAIVRSMGVPAIGLLVYRDADANTLATTAALRETLRQLQHDHPAFPVAVVTAQASFVSDALDNLVQEIVAGGLLSLCLILAVLRDARSALAIGLLAPLSALVALAVLRAFGVSINVLSLGGLALSVGLTVDNAIVVTDATARERVRLGNSSEAALRAARSLSGPLTAGTLTTVLVFAPIVFVEGLAAALFRDLALTVVFSLGTSLALALTLLPVVLSSGPAAATRGSVEPANGTAERSRIRQTIASGYERLMERTLDRPWLALGIAVTTLAAGVLLLMRLPREVLPAVDDGLIAARLRLPHGTTMRETVRQATRVEDAARVAGVTAVYARIGRVSDAEVLAGAPAEGENFGRLLLQTGAGHSERVMARLRSLLPDLAAGALSLDAGSQTEFESLVGRAGRSIFVEVSGPTPSVAYATAARLQPLLAATSTVREVQMVSVPSERAIVVTLDRPALARAGIAPAAVAAVLRAGLGGTAIDALLSGFEDRQVRLGIGDLSGTGTLSAILDERVAGVPLRLLVRAREELIPAEILRVNQRPVALLEAVASDRGTASAAAHLRAVLSRTVLPAGVFATLSGADDEQERVASQFRLVALLAAALVYLVLAGEFGRFTTPLLIMLIVPLSGVGGLAALYVTGQSLNVVSLIGLVIMIGIADNDAVVKLATIEQLRAQGIPLRDAVLRGGRLRLRAIAMTSLTTVLGVVPLLVGWGAGGELYRPLAASVIGGSITALLATLILLPAAYVVVHATPQARQCGS